jgi:hypothetical protein
MLKITTIQDFTSTTNPETNDTGFNNGIKYEPASNITFNAAPGETVLPNKFPKINAYIVFGHDRPGDWSTGYGGRGHDKSAAIDIVAGRVSSFDAREIGGYVNPSIGADASRIYLSQKADIDTYYGIVDGRTGQSIGRAAIAIKSDDIRIVARNTLKIVTGTDSRLSVDEPAMLSSGVQLIANNDDGDLQPIPKGKNLLSYLDEILLRINDLNGIVLGFMEIQDKFNKSLADHVHISPFYGNPTSISPEIIQSANDTSLQLFFKVEQGLRSLTNNITSTKFKFTTPGKDYINSEFHFLN